MMQAADHHDPEPVDRPMSTTTPSRPTPLIPPALSPLTPLTPESPESSSSSVSSASTPSVTFPGSPSSPAPTDQAAPARWSSLAPSDPEKLVVQIVGMRRRHLRTVMRIEAQVYPRPWSTGLYLGELALRSTRAYYVARVHGEVVAYGGLMVTGEDGHITTLAVDPDWRRLKLASRLLVVLARDAIRRQVTALTLEVRVSNVAAQELYRRFGFAPAGVRKRYYVETNEDALVMWAHDVDSPEYRQRLAAIESSIPGRTLFEGPALS